jgi:hypothetical protein
MYKMYSVPYPMLQTLFSRPPIAHMKYLNAEYTFYWADGQILIRKQCGNASAWILQPNANIAESLAAIMDCPADRIMIHDWNLTDALPGDREKFLECSWSDYAVDNLTVSFVCRVQSDSRFSM